MVSVTTVLTIVKLLVNIWFCLSKLHIHFIFRWISILALKRDVGVYFFIF